MKYTAETLPDEFEYCTVYGPVTFVAKHMFADYWQCFEKEKPESKWKTTTLCLKKGLEQGFGQSSKRRKNK